MLRLAFVSLVLLACRATSDAPAAPTSTQSPPAPAPAAETVTTPSAVTPASSAPPPPTAPSAPWPPAPPGIATDWCIGLVQALDEETCYVLPDEPTDELVVYLHGIVPPGRESVQKTNFETVVFNAVRRARAAALIPRGKQGLSGKGRRDWWGWPTSALQHQEHAAALVSSILERQKRLEALVGRAFTRRYVAGSSAGAYFTATLALRGDIEADGFGAMSGGARAFGADPAKLAPKPFYIGYGTHDTVGAAAEALAVLLRSAKWPVQVAKHPLGHGAKEVYLDEAFAFWRAAPSAP